MEMTDKQKFFPLVLIGIFVLSVTVSVLLSNIIVTSGTYSAAAQDLTTLSIADGALYLIECLTPTALQLAVVFISAFSSFGRYISSAVCAYRGISFGYAATLAVGGALSFHSSRLPLVPVPTSACVLTLYLISTAMILYFSWWADNKRIVTPSSKENLRYLRLFFLISGAVFICDLTKILIICCN